MRTERLAPSVATSKHRHRPRGRFLSQRGEELSKSQHAGAVFSQTCSTLPKTKALTARGAGRNLGALLPPFQPPRHTELRHEEVVAWRSSGCWSQRFSRARCRALLPTQGLGEPTRLLLVPPPRWPQHPSASCSVLLRSFSSFTVLRCPSPAGFHLLSHWLGQKSLKKIICIYEEQRIKYIYMRNNGWASILG